MLYFDDVFASKSDYSVKDSNNGLVVEIDLPGFKRTDVKVNVSKRTLSIKAKSNERGQVSKSFMVPATVDISTISSKLEDGVLQINMQYRPDMADRSVDIL